MCKSIREPFNALSHLVAAVLVLAGTAGLIAVSWRQPAAWISFLIFGLAAIFLYVSSTLYHWTPRALPGLQKMDHTAIYVMIAGCYTPLCLLILNGAAGWWVLGLQWSLAILGVTLTLIMAKTPTWVRLVLYLVMGWMALPFGALVIAQAGWAPLAWLIGGGLFYTIGVFFYASRKPILWPGIFSGHEVWHLFVMAGTACHFMLMLAMAG